MEPTSEAPDFRVLFESAPGLYLVLTPGLKIVAVSNAYLQATKTRREEILGRGLFEVFPDNPDEVAATGVGNLRASLMRVLEFRRPDAMAVQKYDIRRPASEGGGFEERHWSPVNGPVFGADGQIAYIIHRVEDVTEFVRLKQAGAELSRATDELRSHAGRMEAEIYRRAQEIQEANARLEERVLARTRELSAANDALTAEMADRQRVEAQFRQAQKMEAVGQLAGGVAHDFNNLLTVILSFCKFIREDLARDHPSQADVAEIEQAAERAASLTRQLLAFSRKQVLDPEILNLNDVVAGTETMLRRLIGEDVQFVTALAKDLGRVKADKGHVEQILMNLLVNARDAMPTGGKLTVETANVELDGQYTHGHVGAKAGPYVMLAVSDTGIGMDAETQAQIFLPFFTTKGVGKGTGLGLAMVHGVVKQSGGEIIVYSTPSKGTTFKVYLPRVEELPSANAAAAAPRPPRVATETVLVVEDEEPVRVVAARALVKAGYSVIAAASPGEALRRCADRSLTFHLLVSDVVMPGMDGPTLAERLNAARPGLKVLFMSGYTGGALVHHGVLASGVAYLQKPFTPDSLVGRVRDVLEGA